MPVSVTVHNDLVYVLNAGAGNNISGFRISADGELWPLEGSIKSLSAMNAGGAQVSFANDGDVLVITEKNTNMIISYTIDSDGLPGMMHTLASANATPLDSLLASMELFMCLKLEAGHREQAQSHHIR